MEVSGQLHTLATLPWGKSLRHPLDRRLGGPHGQSGCCGVEKNLLPLLGIEPRPSNPQPIAIPTELSQFPQTHGSEVECEFLHLHLSVRMCNDDRLLFTTKSLWYNWSTKSSWAVHSFYNQREKEAMNISTTLCS
jgi:hypothetical protein